MDKLFFTVRTVAHTSAVCRVRYIACNAHCLVQIVALCGARTLVILQHTSRKCVRCAALPSLWQSFN